MKKSGLTVLIAAMITAISICSITAFSSKAATTVSEQPATYYKDIILEKGDTLSALADKYNTGRFLTKKEYISEVKKINGLYSDSIHEGCYLTIIYY